MTRRLVHQRPSATMTFVLLLGGAALLGGVAPAAWSQEATERRFEMGDFVLENGRVIEDAYLTYVVHGELNEAHSNAILLLPPIMGNHASQDFMVGPGRALDPEKYFIIAVNTLGNGVAISPSNSRTQRGFDFPQFSIRDMVSAQHRLVRDELELEELLSVVGASMGGMQAYEWAVSYPDFMRSVVPIITLGRTTAWVTGIWETHRQAILADPEGGFRAAIGSLMIWAHNWRWTDEEFSDDNMAVIAWLEGWEDTLVEAWNPIDYVYQTRAEDLHDISTALGMNGDYQRALQSIQARVLLMPSKNDLLHPAEDSRVAAALIPNARLVEIDSPIGHLAGAGGRPIDTEFVNREMANFLAEVAAHRSP